MTAPASSLPNFDGKLALVTGATRGLGRALALSLARQGAHVIALGRRKLGLEELDNEGRAQGLQFSLMPMDLKDGKQIDAIGPTLYQRWQKLDIFVGNAAILGPLSPLTHLSEADWNAEFTVNLTANWRLLRTLDPLLRLAPRGRALMISSGAALNCRAYWGPYSISKAALEALAKTYAHEVESTNVKVNILDPGPMRTRMRAQAFPGEDENTLPLPETVADYALSLLTDEVSDTGKRFAFTAQA